MDNYIRDAFKALKEVEEEIVVVNPNKLHESKKNSKKLEEGLYRGAKDVEFIWHGENADPELEYKGEAFNYWDVEDALWYDFRDEKGYTDSDSDDAEVEAEFDKYVQANVANLLDDWIFANKEAKEDSYVEETKTCKKDAKKLDEAPVYDLTPQYDSRKSFYNKARVDVKDDGTQVLYSYNTPVCRIDKEGNVTLLRKGYLGWSSSQTTLRHVKEFLKQNNKKTGTVKELADMYPVEQADVNESKEESNGMKDRLDKYVADNKLDEAKEKYSIRYWENEEARDKGESATYLTKFNDLEEAKKEADKLFKNYSSVEVVENQDTEDEKVAYGLYPENESLEESYEDLEEVFEDMAQELADKCNEVFPEANVTADDIVFDDSRAWSLYVPGSVLGLNVNRFGAYRNYLGGGMRDAIQNNGREQDNTVELGNAFAKALEQVENILNDSESTDVDESCKESLTESTKIDINEKEDIEKGKELLTKEVDNEDTEQIVDVDAETIDELKDSYVGNAILQCKVCKTLLYKKPELLLKDEGTELYNIEDECPHCGSKDGYDLVGQVASMNVEVEKENTDTTGKDEIKIDENPKEEKEDNNEENVEQEFTFKNEDLDRISNTLSSYITENFEDVENFSTKDIKVEDDKIQVVAFAKFKESNKIKRLNLVCESKNNNEYTFTSKSLKESITISL